MAFVTRRSHYFGRPKVKMNIPNLITLARLAAVPVVIWLILDNDMKIYVKSCLAALETGGVHGLAHITGGGLLENIPRVLADGLAATVDVSTWPLPPVFGWLAKKGAIAPLELARTFNCGIGMAVIAADEKTDAVERALRDAGEIVFHIGAVTEAADAGDTPAVHLNNMEDAWPP